MRGRGGRGVLKMDVEDKLLRVRTGERSMSETGKLA